MLEQELTAIKQILSGKKYLLIFLISSFIFFLIFYFLTLWTVTDKSLKIFIMMNGHNYTFFSFLLLGIISLLLGVYVSLFVYKIKLINKKKLIGLTGVFSFISGVFASGCPMCGAFLFGLLGFPLALFFMPFKGLELRILALLLSSLSVYFLARSLEKCGVTNKYTKK